MARAPSFPATDVRLRLARAGFGALGLIAVLAQLKVGLEQPDPQVVNFFAFFTIESSLFFAAVWLSMALRPPTAARRDAIRGAATLYMTITGVVYWTLLQWTDADLGLTRPWVDTVLHLVLPLVAIADWLLAPTSRPVTRATALRWLLFPVVYFSVSLVRGYVVGWYPYPFLDPGLQRGYSGVLLTAAVLIVLIAGLALALRALGERRRTAAPAPL